VKDGTLTQWSHMLGVTRDARDGGLGLRLKLAQRDRALDMGVDLVEWTYDPLQALNAHLNFSKLGVVVEEYEENISACRAVRCTAVHRRSLRRPVAPQRAARAAAYRGTGRRPRARRVRGVGAGRQSLAPGRTMAGARAGRSDAHARRLLVEIPVGVAELQMEDPALALEWRLATRAIFQHYFQRGYSAVDFFLSRASGRGHYLLSVTPTNA
jgi:predicted GNAT superfamily acetyltransferase